jgi:iron complex transport system substrate-binding protein
VPSPAGGCQRLVTLAPNLTELAFALGLGERVAGVGDHSQWPLEAAALPRLGGLFDPRVEAIAALGPDLALLLPSQEELGRQLAPLGIESLVLPSESLGDVEAAAEALARRCGAAAGARRFLQQWRRELAPRPALEGAAKPRVLLVLGRQPGSLRQIIVAGPGTFLHELLERLGVDNAFGDARLRYPQASLEAILARDPSHIVELHGEALTAEVVAELQRDWRRLPRLSAVRHGRVEVVAADFTLIPGPRLPELYRALAAALGLAGHPVVETEAEPFARE